MRYLIFLFSFFFIHLNVQCTESSFFEDLLTQELVPWENRPCVVLDIDETMTFSCYTNNVFDRQEVQRNQPLSYQVPVFDYKVDRTHKSTLNHVMLPNSDTLIWMILSWGWDIDIFSAGLAWRNDQLMINFITLSLMRRGVEKELSQRLMEHLFKDRIRIFSRDHMTENESKKDLTVLGRKLSNTLLVDDFPPISVEGEEQGVMLASRLLRGSKFEQEDPWHAHMYFVISTLNSCRNYMAQEAVPLRIAATMMLALEQDNPHLRPREVDQYPFCVVATDLSSICLSFIIDDGQRYVADFKIPKISDVFFDMYEYIWLCWNPGKEFPKHPPQKKRKITAIPDITVIISPPQDPLPDANDLLGDVI